MEPARVSSNNAGERGSRWEHCPRWLGPVPIGLLGMTYFYSCLGEKLIIISCTVTAYTCSSTAPLTEQGTTLSQERDHVTALRVRNVHVVSNRLCQFPPIRDVFNCTRAIGTRTAGALHHRTLELAEPSRAFGRRSPLPLPSSPNVCQP